MFSMRFLLGGSKFVHECVTMGLTEILPCMVGVVGISGCQSSQVPSKYLVSATVRVAE